MIYLEIFVNVEDFSTLISKDQEKLHHKDFVKKSLLCKLTVNKSYILLGCSSPFMASKRYLSMTLTIAFLDNPSFTAKTEVCVN